jgi:hypothetical protein
MHKLKKVYFSSSLAFPFETKKRIYCNVKFSIRKKNEKSERRGKKGKSYVARMEVLLVQPRKLTEGYIAITVFSQFFSLMNAIVEPNNGESLDLMESSPSAESCAALKSSRKRKFFSRLSVVKLSFLLLFCVWLVVDDKT